MSKSKTVVYDMRRDGWVCYFEMHVSPTAQAMRSHIRSFYAKRKRPVPDNLKDTLGMVSPLKSSYVANKDPFAFLFLNEENMGGAIVGNECLHVAMAHERFVLCFGMGYGPEIGTDEERLAYFFSDCIKGVFNTLYEHGHIKK